MSKIRVYELAKEAGMSSKALTDKLIELGFDIKGHSSSVDDETAETIRNTILKSVDTELVEKRIDSEKNGATVIRRRATVIRRRPMVNEDVPEADSVAAKVAEADQKKPAQDLAPEQPVKEVPVPKSEPVAEKEQAVTPETTPAPSQKMEEPEVVAQSEEKAVPPVEMETKDEQAQATTAAKDVAHAEQDEAPAQSVPAKGEDGPAPSAARPAKKVNNPHPEREWPESYEPLSCRRMRKGQRVR